MEDRGDLEPDSGGAAASFDDDREPAWHPPRREDVVEEAAFVVLESGRMSFFVRPRVGLGAADGWADVQSLSLLMAPRSGAVVRRVTVGGQRMPDGGGREGCWACVDRVGPEDAIAKELLAPKTYATRTRGLRCQAAAVEVATGAYAIATHRDHAHLFFALEGRGEAFDSLVRQLRIPERASYIAAVFHPSRRVAPARLRGRRVSLSPGARGGRDEAPLGEPSVADELADRFGDRRFLPLEPALLDRVGAELLLVGGGRRAAPSPCSTAVRAGGDVQRGASLPRAREGRALTRLG